MDLEKGTPPAYDAALSLVTLAELKANLHIFHNVEDAHLASCIRRAASTVERDLRRSVLKQAYTLYLSGFQSKIELPLPPLLNVVSVKYQDAANATQTVAGSNYIVRKTPLNSPFGHIEFLSSFSTPELYDTPRAVAVEFEAGIEPGTTHSGDVQELKSLVLLLAGHFYTNPEATVMETKTTNVNRKISFGYDFLADSLRIPHDYEN